VRFQVDGIFGYCPGCRSENLRVYDADIAIIRQEAASDPIPARALRRAYTDLVSTFEIFCRKEAARHEITGGRFQNLISAQKTFQSALGVDIIGTSSSIEALAMRRVFQKRHVAEHNGGIIDDRYVREIPEDATLLGQAASYSLDEFELAAFTVRQALESLVRAR
jgi:hypothetical protein